MMETILQVQATELTFNTKDVIYIITIVVAAVTAFFKMTSDKNAMTKEIGFIQKNISDNKSHIDAVDIASKNSRTHIRREFKEADEKDRDMLNQRIDIVKEDLKEHAKDTASEFKEIQGKLNKIIGLLEKK